MLVFFSRVSPHVVLFECQSFYMICCDGCLRFSETRGHQSSFQQLQLPFPLLHLFHPPPLVLPCLHPQPPPRTFATHQLKLTRPVVGRLAGGSADDALDTGEVVTVWVSNISNYDAHVAGAPAITDDLGPLTFRRYEQRYDHKTTGVFGELQSYKKRYGGGGGEGCGRTGNRGVVVRTEIPIRIAARGIWSQVTARRCVRFRYPHRGTTCPLLARGRGF